MELPVTPTLTTVAHLPALGAHERPETGHLLQATLVELLDLALTGKQLHWNVAGPGFRSLHLQLDDLVAGWQDLADTVAERAVAVGAAADGRPATIAASSGLPPVAAGPVTVVAALGVAVERVAVVAEEVRRRVERLAEIDPVAQDVLIDVLRALETQLWMLRTELGPAGHG